MKIMNVSLTIDVCNEEHVKALEVFTRTLGGLPLATPINGSSLKVAATVETEEEAPAKNAAKPRPSRAKAKPVVEEVEEVETEEEEENFLDEEEEETDDLVIDHVLLRGMVAERSAKHRPALKERFEEMGVANVSSIPENKLKSFHAFLLTLKV